MGDKDKGWEFSANVMFPLCYQVSGDWVMLGEEKREDTEVSVILETVSSGENSLFWVRLTVRALACHVVSKISQNFPSLLPLTD